MGEGSPTNTSTSGLSFCTALIRSTRGSYARLSEVVNGPAHTSNENGSAGTRNNAVGWAWLTGVRDTAVEPPLVDTSRKRALPVSGHQSEVPAIPLENSVSTTSHKRTPSKRTRTTILRSQQKKTSRKRTVNRKCTPRHQEMALNNCMTFSACDHGHAKCSNLLTGGQSISSEIKVLITQKHKSASYLV